MFSHPRFIMNTLSLTKSDVEFILTNLSELTCSTISTNFENFVELLNFQQIKNLLFIKTY